MMLPARSRDNFTCPPGDAHRPIGWFSHPPKDVNLSKGRKTRDRGCRHRWNDNRQQEGEG